MRHNIIFTESVIYCKKSLSNVQSVKVYIAKERYTYIYNDYKSLILC